MLELRNLDVYLNENQILKSVNLQINHGEFVSLLGPSGCGKSTLLKTICGFLPHRSGSIFSDGQCIDSRPIHLRNIVMVFQDLRLFPNMLAWENVAFPLKMQGCPKSERKKLAYELLDQVNLRGLENRKIDQLSGGQKQRVALARAFAAKPQYLLLDEPFSGLDDELKEEMRELLCCMHKKYKNTVIFVTHDKHEALTLSDRIAVMDKGEILQFGTPRDVYERPQNIRIAEYFGERNFIEGEIIGGKFLSGILQLKTDKADGRYLACIPYNAAKISEEGLDFKVEKIQYMGQSNKINVNNGNVQLCFMANSESVYALGTAVRLKLDASKILYEVCP